MRVTSLLNSGADVETRTSKVCYSPTMVVWSSDYAFSSVESNVMWLKYHRTIFGEWVSQLT